MTELADRPATEPARTARRLAGVEVNELLTSSAAALLVILLIAEGITILDMRGLLGPHMFIGLVLIGPVAHPCTWPRARRISRCAHWLRCSWRRP